MKTPTALLTLGLILSTPVFAETVYVKDAHKHHSHQRNVTVHDKTVDTDTWRDNEDKRLRVEPGYAQNLVQFTKDINLQGSVGKDVWYTEADEGYVVRLYVTNAKPLVDLTK